MDGQSPKLGGEWAKGAGAPGLKKEFVALRNWIMVCLDWGDTATLGGRPDVVTPYLIEIVGDPARENRIRAFAAVALGEMRREDAIPALGRTLQRVVHERDNTVLMFEVIEALERIDTPAAKAALNQAGLAG